MSRKPHVCHIVNGFAPGGAEVRTTIFMNGLGAEFRHTVVSRRDIFDCVKMLSPEVEIDCVSFEGKTGGLRTPFYLGRLLRKLRPDLVCIYNWAGIDGAIASVLFRVKPWIAILDGFGAEEASAELMRRRLTRRFCYRRADAVVCVSRGLEELARTSWRVDPRRILRIPNGIDTDVFRPGAAVSIRERFGIPADAPLVGTVAHLRPEKEPAKLCRAFARVADEFPRAHLLFVGGIWRAGIMEGLRAEIDAAGMTDRVHFAGQVSNPPDYYRAFDVFALTSRTEQMPMSIAEAMACGKPVVSTDVGDVRAMLAPSNRPFVVPFADDAAYVAALRRLLAEPETRRALAEANRETAVRELNRDAMIGEYRSLFRRLVDPSYRKQPKRSLAGRVKGLVRRAGSVALYSTGLLDLIAWYRRRFRGEHAAILSFHCVSDSSRPERRYFRPGMNIDSHQFRDLLVALRRRYRLLSLHDAVRELHTPSPGKRPAVAITFDDGYRSVYVNAFPILRELDVPATVFLPTAYIGTGRLLWWDEVHHLVESAPERVLPLLAGVVPLDSPARSDDAVSHMKYLARPEREALLARMRAAAGDLPSPAERVMMNWDEVREMRAAGIDFGSHTVSHRYLDALDREALRRELGGARHEIERELGAAPAAVAYPDGRFNDVVVEEARAAGYRYAVSTITGINDAKVDLFALRRQDGGIPAGNDVAPSFAVMWAELLGVWDLLFLRRRRVPERFSRYRPQIKAPP